MKIVFFNNAHVLDLQHNAIYYDWKALENVDKTVSEIEAFGADLIVEQEFNDGKSIFTSIYDRLPNIKKAYWAIDMHCNLIDHVVYAKGFDYIFCAQSWFIPIVEREVKGKVFYLPLCHTQTLTEYEEMLKTPVEKDIEYSFIGNIRSIHVDRKKQVTWLLENYPSFVARQADYDKSLNYLRRSYATFNCSLNNDLNFRVWEALACDAQVVTDDVTDINNIKGLREYLGIYPKLIPNWHSMHFVTKKDGYKFIKQNHTLTHRMNQMIDMVNDGKQVYYAV